MSGELILIRLVQSYEVPDDEFDSDADVEELEGLEDDEEDEEGDEKEEEEAEERPRKKVKT